MVHRFRFSTLLALAAALVALGILSSGDAADASGNGGQGSGQPTAFSMLGVANVGGETVIVDVVVAVPAGQNAAEVARAALAAQGARPFDSANLGSEGFTLTGLVWDNPAPPVEQNYNPGSSATKDEPVEGLAALTNTHATWGAVPTSFFSFDSFDPTVTVNITDRCPSLVRECPGRQTFDGENDVAWLKLRGNVLGVTWFGTSTDEADIALNVSFDWVNDFDAETVFLHENGHVVGLGHSDITGAIMEPVYAGVRQTLHNDDKEGATYLYPTQTATVQGTATDDTVDSNPIANATVTLEGTPFSAETNETGNYEITGVPYPVTYEITASHPNFDSSSVRLKVDTDSETVDFTLTAAGGEEDDGGGGGPPKCVPKRFC